jgi:predicted nucleic acid-binding protein
VSAFADSSALVKLYVPEGDEDTVVRLGSLVVSDLSRVEVVSALWRKHRLGLVSAEDTGTLVRRFDAEFVGAAGQLPRFGLVLVASELLRGAPRLIPSHGLSAGDAIQLASALAARRADPECRTFACFDRRLRAAAAAERFAVVP